MDKSGTVYILKSLKNNSYYIGSKTNLARRLTEHNAGNTSYTANLLPFQLVFSQIYPTLNTSRKVEMWLKSLHSKIILEQIIQDGYISKNFD